MPSFTVIMLLGGVVASAMLALSAFSGPSAGKLVSRRLEDLRERHSRSTDVAAQAQLKRIYAQRQNRGDGFAKRFIPKPALLQLRLSQPISETVGIVADELQAPVGTEFRTVADKMRIGRTMDVALQETANRLGTAEFQFFVISLAIQRETGGNLAETLSNLADVLRKRSAMKLKIRAMSSESKPSAYIIGALPFIVFGLIWFINGKYMQNFFVDERLMMVGGGGMVWMAIGAFIMAKMINFEI